MQTIISTNAPIFIVLSLLFGAYLLPVFNAKRLYICKCLFVLVESITLIGALYLANQVLSSGPFSYNLGGWTPPWGLEITIDPLSSLFLITIGIISLPIAIYTLPQIATEVGGGKRAIWFLTLFLLHTAGLCGIALSHDLFNLYVFIEVATISGVALVAANSKPIAIEAAFKYLIMATIGSGFILAGIAIIYMITGNLNIVYVNRELSSTWQDYPHAIWIALSFFLVGFGIKSALFPLHSWLPDAHSSAITPASALLSGLAVKGYIIGLIKVFFSAIGIFVFTSLGIAGLLRILGMVSIIVGSIFALAQKEIKRRLAFSTISQLGYIFLGLSLGTESGLTGALFYITSHALIKSTLFLAAGSMIQQTGHHAIADLAGIGRKMPLTMAAFTTASLAMIGLPLLSGFVGKWYLVAGSLASGDWLAMSVIVAGGLLAAAYLLPIIRAAYFEPIRCSKAKEVPYVQAIPLLVIGFAIIFFGCYPSFLLKLASHAATMLLAG